MSQSQNEITLNLSNAKDIQKNSINRALLDKLALTLYEISKKPALIEENGKYANFAQTTDGITFKKDAAVTITYNNTEYSVQTSHDLIFQPPKHKKKSERSAKNKDQVGTLRISSNKDPIIGKETNANQNIATEVRLPHIPNSDNPDAKALKISLHVKKRLFGDDMFYTDIRENKHNKIIKVADKTHAGNTNTEHLNSEERDALDLESRINEITNLGRDHTEYSHDGKTAYQQQYLRPGVELGDDNILKLALPEKLDIMIKLLEQYIKNYQSKGILHRDLKLENILYDIQTNTLSIIDHDLSKKAKENGIFSANQTVGTLPYISPEILTNGSMVSYRESSDMYSIAHVCAFLLDPTLLKTDNKVINDVLTLENSTNSTALALQALHKSRTEQSLSTRSQLSYDNPKLFSLLEKMANSASENRPTAKEALQQLKEIKFQYEHSGFTPLKNNQEKDITEKLTSAKNLLTKAKDTYDNGSLYRGYSLGSITVNQDNDVVIKQSTYTINQTQIKSRPVGEPTYQSPQVFPLGHYDEYSEVFSLGVTLAYYFDNAFYQQDTARYKVFFNKWNAKRGTNSHILPMRELEEHRAKQPVGAEFNPPQLATEVLTRRLQRLVLQMTAPDTRNRINMEQALQRLASIEKAQKLLETADNYALKDYHQLITARGHLCKKIVEIQDQDKDIQDELLNNLAELNTLLRSGITSEQRQYIRKELQQLDAHLAVNPDYSADKILTVLQDIFKNAQPVIHLDLSSLHTIETNTSHMQLLDALCQQHYQDEVKGKQLDKNSYKLSAKISANKVIPVKYNGKIYKIKLSHDLLYQPPKGPLSYITEDSITKFKLANYVVLDPKKIAETGTEKTRKTTIHNLYKADDADKIYKLSIYQEGSYGKISTRVITLNPKNKENWHGKIIKETNGPQLKNFKQKKYRRNEAKNNQLVGLGRNITLFGAKSDYQTQYRQPGLPLSDPIFAEKSIQDKVTIAINLFKAYKETCADKGLIHRDLKSENILVDPDTHAVKIIDWEFAIPCEQGNIIQTNDLCGTAPYMAPELLESKYSSSSDIYAMGKVLGYLFSDNLRKNDYRLHEHFNQLYRGNRKEVLGGVTRHYGKAPINYRSFTELSATPEIFTPLASLILSMVNQNSTQRPKAEEIITSLETINKKFQTHDLFKDLRPDWRVTRNTNLLNYINNFGDGDNKSALVKKLTAIHDLLVEPKIDHQIKLHIEKGLKKLNDELDPETETDLAKSLHDIVVNGIKFKLTEYKQNRENKTYDQHRGFFGRKEYSKTSKFAAVNQVEALIGFGEIDKLKDIKKYINEGTQLTNVDLTKTIDQGDLKKAMQYVQYNARFIPSSIVTDIINADFNSTLTPVTAAGAA